MKTFTYPFLLTSIGFVACQGPQSKVVSRPNVIIVLSDDQGIGGLSCHNNPYLKTPHLDRFYEESVRMTDFHVSPMSTPTRSAVISGRYPIRNGAWATFKGRDILARTTATLPELFQQAGYQTAQFGKWHLGDNYPSRAIDCGFDHVVNHRSGGVGELSDYWGNNYFDDTYWVNEVPTPFKGYCTDVWFDQTIQYIDQAKTKEKPFFVYLATNAPHSPHYVAEKYSAPFKALEEQGVLSDAGFYGQIANLDENFGRLDQYLKETGLDQNTIVIFFTDNGAGRDNNAWINGYAGAKGSKLEGGHRVPFFIRWYEGGISGGRDIQELTAHVDLLPTLTALCGIEVEHPERYDGIDFSRLLTQQAHVLPERSVFIHHRQDYQPPMDVKGACIAKEDWRLIDGNKLYNIALDQAQKHNVAHENGPLVESLLAENKRFVNASKALDEYQHFVPIVAGAEQQRVATLTIQHAIGKSGGLWKAEQICAGIKVENDEYAIEFAQAGSYRISLARWPRECQGTIWGVPAVNPKNWFTYQTIHPEEAQIEIFGKVHHQAIDAEMKEVDFVIEAPKGRAMLSTRFIEEGKSFGAYYIYIEQI